jgi:uncharacterized protein
MVRGMKLGGRERTDDAQALEGLFADLPRKVDWTMGFLTAVCTGPDAIDASVWLPVILPDGALDDEAAAREKVDLLARLYGAVAETLRTTPAIIPPEPDKSDQEAVDFCGGYVRGAELHERWRADPQATELLRPFEVLAGPDARTVAGEAVVDELREALGDRVAAVHAYWQAKRQVVRTTPRVGRNDPCPCGSGKKHKKCCLGKQL